ncbi:MAG: hypothetical protein AAF497_09375 [Planctomycetota bacterium]
MNRFKPCCVPFVTCLILFAMIGCGPKNQGAELDNSRLYMINTLLDQCHAMNGKRPKDEPSFKQFISSKTPKAIETAGCSSVDELFTSQRDGKPFVVLYDKPLNHDGRGINAYEQSGKDGQRMVAFDTGNVELMASDELERLLAK